MPLRWRATAAALVCALHLALFVPTIGDWSSILVNDFAPQARAIRDGDLPYRDQDIEYPPLSVPVLIAPAYVDDSTQGFTDGFMWEMLGFDLAMVVLIAFGLPGDRRRVISAVGIYTVGVVTLSGVVLDPSLIDTGPLILTRFDLVPALFVLAAVLARDRCRSATWSALVSIGAGIKAFPLLLYPALARGEPNPRRAIVAGAMPLLVCAAAVLVIGDEFGSAISYHTERALQVESLAASPFEIAHELGGGAKVVTGHGGFEISAGGATAARWISVLVGAAGYLTLVLAGWRSRATNLELVTALLAMLVVFSPVLSPQFLLWLLPVSACAYGLGRENAILLLAVLFTQIGLQHYDGVDSLDPSFVWPVAARNGFLLVYLGLVASPILRDGGLLTRSRLETTTARRAGSLASTAIAAIAMPKNQGM
ncbi:MAG TPA: glycosyltransferase 87 family protein [Solirubrobacterales bacterium]|nr:glycosyltransferase 87 family protein [Solirubrobacterales bacterium]